MFDCFGAGQNVSQQFFAGTSWIEQPDTKDAMFAAFKTAKQLHEMLWYLVEAQARTHDPEGVERVTNLRNTIGQALDGDLEKLQSLDVQELHSEVRSALMEISEEVRGSYFAAGDDHLDSYLKAGADLMGKNLSSRKLCGADLRGAYLIAADLRLSDLSGVDLLGADLRDARLEGTDLSKALYLTQPQLNAATGNQTTSLPSDLEVPSHWCLR